MKRFLVILLLGFPALARADTTTNRLLLTVPTVGSSGWAPKINTDMQLIDAKAAALGLPNVFTSSNVFTNLIVTSSMTLSSFTVTNATVGNLTVTGPATIQGASPILSTSTLQSGATFYVSSGTVAQLQVSTMTGLTSINAVSGLPITSSNTWTGQQTLSSATITQLQVSTITALTSINAVSGLPIISSNTWTGQQIMSSATVKTINISSMTTNNVNGFITSLSPIRFSPTTNGIVGTTTNDAAAAGEVGEVITSAVSATNFTTSGQYGDLTSISLTAGDWDTWVTGTITNNGATSTQFIIGTSVNSGNSGTGLTDGVSDVSINNMLSSTQGIGAAVGPVRRQLTTTTPVYLKYYCSYTGGPPQLAAQIYARRIR